MCFSVHASFAAGLLLSALGIISLKTIRSKQSVFLASIPLLFALQQFSEGFVWLGFTRYAPFVFLTFALIIWPIWIPLSLANIEKERTAKALLTALIFAGASLATFFLLCMYHYTVHTSIINKHIFYSITGLPNSYLPYLLIYYCLCVVLPFFISTINSIRLFGILLILSLAASLTFWCLFFTSVWCFFAALLSSCILYILYKNKL